MRSAHFSFVGEAGTLQLVDLALGDERLAELLHAGGAQGVETGAKEEEISLTNMLFEADYAFSVFEVEHESFGIFNLINEIFVRKQSIHYIILFWELEQLSSQSVLDVLLPLVQHWLAL